MLRRLGLPPEADKPLARGFHEKTPHKVESFRGGPSGARTRDTLLKRQVL
jgi:hypothetical protein